MAEWLQNVCPSQRNVAATNEAASGARAWCWRIQDSAAQESDSTVHPCVQKHACVDAPEPSGDICVLALGCWVQTESQVSTGKSGSSNIWKQLPNYDQCLVQLSCHCSSTYSANFLLLQLCSSVRMTGIYKHAMSLSCRFCQTCRNKHTCFVTTHLCLAGSFSAQLHIRSNGKGLIMAK